MATSAEEKGESKEYEAKEKEGSVDESYIIPEEFQRQVQELVSECESKECLSYIRECVYRKEDELRKAEMAKKPKSKTPDKFSKDEMPASVY